MQIEAATNIARALIQTVYFAEYGVTQAALDALNSGVDFQSPEAPRPGNFTNEVVDFAIAYAFELRQIDNCNAKATAHRSDVVAHRRNRNFQGADRARASMVRCRDSAAQLVSARQNRIEQAIKAGVNFIMLHRSSRDAAQWEARAREAVAAAGYDNRQIIEASDVIPDDDCWIAKQVAA